MVMSTPQRHYILQRKLVILFFSKIFNALKTSGYLFMCDEWFSEHLSSKFRELWKEWIVPAAPSAEKASRSRTVKGTMKHSSATLIIYHSPSKLRCLFNKLLMFTWLGQRIIKVVFKQKVHPLISLIPLPFFITWLVWWPTTQQSEF